MHVHTEDKNRITSHPVSGKTYDQVIAKTVSDYLQETVELGEKSEIVTSNDMNF